MTSGTPAVKWGYALNQWDTNIDEFVRDRDHERAFKTISVCGFPGIELTALSFGPWEPLGNPDAIAARYGSPAALLRRLNTCRVDAVCSFMLDPAIGFETEMGRGPDPLDSTSRDKLVDTARWFSSTLRELGGSVLVARPVGSAWQTGRIDEERMRALAETWTAVGEATQASGVRLCMHFDFLSGLRLDDGLERFLAAADPACVGVALDTAEFAIAGLDPVAFYSAHADRVWHLHFKQAQDRVDETEALTPHADHAVRTAGGEREIGRWFYEPSDEGGLVDFVALTAELAQHGYRGWIVVETDGSPYPAKSAMLSGWYVQKVLAPLLAYS